MKEVFRRRRLPHWDMPGAIYFVTTCLEGSIPAQGLLDRANYEEGLESRSRPAEMTEHDWKARKWKLLFSYSERWLDERPAVRHLEDERLASNVVETIYHFASIHYDLLGYVVMPSHMH